MRIAVDLDATITAYPRVFSVLTSALAEGGHDIYIVTDRPIGTEEEVRELLLDCQITYHHIKITPDKAHFILNENIELIFDDTDQYFVQLPESVAVLKIRQHYNFDFEDKKWIYTSETGRQVGWGRRY